MPLWQIDIYPAEGFTDRDGQRTSQQISELGLGHDIAVDFARGFLVEGDLQQAEATRIAHTLLSDRLTERAVVATVGDDDLTEPPGDNPTLVHVLPKPGVMDPVADSTISAARDAGW
ncbi:MAG TPA: phosphoribosylformylglycinamidine synthase, partial [Planctomycetaceae bacterium]|nr:phosphoribosylformylglycinamidine synthase [Planctomycetaceae bacterium]